MTRTKKLFHYRVDTLPGRFIITPKTSKDQVREKYPEATINISTAKEYKTQKDKAIKEGTILQKKF